MKRVPAILAITLGLFLSACTGGPETAERGVAPLIGSADGTDAADTSCQIVLREVARVRGGGGGYKSVCNDSGCWYMWQGSVDISEAAVAEGATPEITYQSGSDPSWWVVGTSPVEGAASGYQRYSFYLYEHTVSPGMSTTSLMRTRIQMAPYLLTSAGGRLFDHNRNPGAFDNYVLEAENQWSIDDDASVCGADAGAVPVELGSAQVFTLFDYPAITHTTLKGIVHASGGATSADDESVVVHYRIHEGTNLVRDWSTVDAAPVSQGVWEFATPVFDSSCPHYCPSHVYQFAIAHTAAGVTQWDNNGGPGVDYVLADHVSSTVPVYYGPPGILDAPVQLSYLSWQGGPAGGSARGEILLSNIAYHKEVTVVYSTDGWQTSSELAARFSRVSYDNLEFWQFFVPFDQMPTNLQVGIRYQVDGATYLDTNLGRYYRL